MHLGKELTKNYAMAIDILSSFEHEFGITKLEPSLKFKRHFLFFAIPTRCGYEIYQDKAKALYDSIKPKNQENPKQKHI